MIHNKTYNNIIDTLKKLGDAHKIIQTTTSGDIWEIDLNKNTKYPLMHINPVNVQTGPSTLTYNFQIFIMDLVSEKSNWKSSNYISATNLSNNQEVLSECLQICTDIIGMLRHSGWQSEVDPLDINEPVIFAEGEFNIEPFQERFDQEVTGWVFSLPVIAQYDFQTCEIPVHVRPIVQ